jgi:hypothetical protein
MAGPGADVLSLEKTRFGGFFVLHSSVKTLPLDCWKISQCRVLSRAHADARGTPGAGRARTSAHSALAAAWPAEDIPTAKSAKLFFSFAPESYTRRPISG